MKQPNASIILNGDGLEAFSLRSVTRQGCPLAPRLFNGLLEILARAIRQEKIILNVLFVDDMILFIGEPKDSIQ